jgi:multiple sugar transport system permease protein
LSHEITARPVDPFGRLIAAVMAPRRWNRHHLRTYAIALLFVLPALLNFAVFRYVPILDAVRTSFWRSSLLAGDQEMVGFSNYVYALTQDPVFWQSMKVTALFVLGYVPIQVVLALALAVFTNQNRPGIGIIRALIFVPVVVSFIVVSIILGMVFNKDFGLLNALLQSLGITRLEYLTSLTNALPTIIAICVWKDVGYSVMILVPGLKGIPGEYYEAAVVDGASAWQRFRHITLPMLRRPLAFVVVTTTMFAFQVFIPVYSLTRGGPSRTTLAIVYYIYRKAFLFGEMGYASALSVILLVVIVIISALQTRLLLRED